jgi:hypothetical protein
LSFSGGWDFCAIWPEPTTLSFVVPILSFSFQQNFTAALQSMSLSNALFPDTRTWDFDQGLLRPPSSTTMRERGEAGGHQINGSLCLSTSGYLRGSGNMWPVL